MVWVQYGALRCEYECIHKSMYKGNYKVAKSNCQVFRLLFKTVIKRKLI